MWHDTELGAAAGQVTGWLYRAGARESVSSCHDDVG